MLSTTPQNEQMKTLVTPTETSEHETSQIQNTDRHQASQSILSDYPSMTKTHIPIFYKGSFNNQPVARRWDKNLVKAHNDSMNDIRSHSQNLLMNS